MDELGDEWMCEPFRLGGIAVDHVKYLRFNVLSEFCDLPRLVVAFHQSQIENGVGMTRKLLDAQK